MQFTLVALSVLASAIPSVAAVIPQNYPQPLTDTSYSGDPFVLLVNSENPALHFRSVQLAGTNPSLAVIDNVDSPVLAIQMRKGNLYSQTVDFSNNIKDDGRLGGFRTLSSLNQTTQQALIFRPTKGAAAPFAKSLGGWQLFNFGDAGNYGLYHNEPVGVTNGFIACPTGQGAARRFEIRYYESKNQDGGQSGAIGCEFIGLTTTIAPKINETGVYFTK